MRGADEQQPRETNLAHGQAAVIDGASSIQLARYVGVLFWPVSLGGCQSLLAPGGMGIVQGFVY